MDDKEHTYFNDFPRLPAGLTILPWVLWALIAGMVIGGVFYASKALADSVVVHSYSEPGVTIQLTTGKCVDESSIYILMMNAPQYLDRAKAISSNWLHKDGTRKDYAGCWIELKKEEIGSEENGIFMVFSDGQYILVPKSTFTKKKGQVGV